VGGNMGSTVTVKGLAAGETTTLTAHIVGSTIPPAEFNVEVADLQDVYADVWVVCYDNGYPCVSALHITNVFNAGNAYMQHGRMNLRIRNITYTNRQDWLTAPDSRTANMNIRGLPHKGGALKVVFIENITSGTLGFSGNYCIGLTANATGVVFAHEVGHAGKLNDIYPYRNGVTVSGFVASNRMHLKDWGAGYYSNDLTQSNLIQRLLMCGYATPTMGHIPHGSVQGLDTNSVLKMINVGLDSLVNQPTHPSR